MIKVDIRYIYIIVKYEYCYNYKLIVVIFFRLEFFYIFKIFNNVLFYIFLWYFY